jgi:hypothetical protein
MQLKFWLHLSVGYDESLKIRPEACLDNFSQKIILFNNLKHFLINIDRPLFIDIALFEHFF